tara:strand:+ start:12707 stop:12973 length:267 start_codon:yes stop_codon:yes gene_type:complete
MHARYNDGYDSADYYERRYGRHYMRRDYAPAEDGTLSKVLLVIMAIIFPPLAVFFMYGFRGEFWLNLLLLIFFYIPSLIHAVWLIARR